jgi:hypothetical protein
VLVRDAKKGSLGSHERRPTDPIFPRWALRNFNKRSLSLRMVAKLLAGQPFLTLASFGETRLGGPE